MTTHPWQGVLRSSEKSEKTLYICLCKAISKYTIKQKHWTLSFVFDCLIYQSFLGFWVSHGFFIFKIEVFNLFGIYPKIWGPLHGSQPCPGKGACITQRSHAVRGHPRQTGHSEDFWQNVVHWRRKRQPTPVFSPGEFHGQRSLAGYSPWDHKE